MLSAGRQWWHQFPAPLRELATVRLVASFGAGGVLYLTPMVFHQADFSASQVGSGLAVAALAGTIGRFASGWLLDLGLTCGLPVLLAGLCGFLGDALLMGAHQQQGITAEAAQRRQQHGQATAEPPIQQPAAHKAADRAGQGCQCQACAHLGGRKVCLVEHHRREIQHPAGAKARHQPHAGQFSQRRGKLVPPLMQR